MPLLCDCSLGPSMEGAAFLSRPYRAGLNSHNPWSILWRQFSLAQVTGFDVGPTACKKWSQDSTWGLTGKSRLF